MRHDRLGTLDTVSGNVKIDVDSLLHERTIDEQLEHSKNSLPGLYIAYMKYINDDKKIEECMILSKNKRDDLDNFHIYI